MTLTTMNQCSSGAFHGCNAHMRYDGALSRALLGFAYTGTATNKTKLVFYGGRAHRVYPSEHRTRWGVKYNKLLQLMRRLHR